MTKTKKHIEYSKFALNYILILSTSTVLFTYYIVLKTENVEPLIVLIPLIFAELGVGTMFYYKKAERENIVKLKRQNRDISFDETGFLSDSTDNENCG